MKITINSITGFEDAFVAMYISKRTWTPELDREIRNVCNSVLDRNGRMIANCDSNDLKRFNNWISMLLRMGKKHITLLRYLTISIMTEGIHRAGQDDIDSHVKRFENKIIRSSTRLATFNDNEMSDWYKGKILTDGQVAKILGYNFPETLEYMGNIYYKTTNGYVREEYKNNKDVKRGLYMLSIPSNFISEISLCEFGHVFKERNRDSNANPEVKEWAEAVCSEIGNFHSQITRDYILSIEN